MKGYKTYLTVAIGVLFSVASLFGITFGELTQAQVQQAIDVIILLALAFVRHSNTPPTA